MDHVASGNGYWRWSPALSVNVPALDSDHRCLMRILSLLQGLEDGEEAETMIPTVLETFSLYVWFHQEREERVMADVNFPGIAVHREEHRALLGSLASLRQEHGRKPSAAVAASLYETLVTWFVHHHLLQDMAYKPYIVDGARAEEVARAGAADCLLGFTLTVAGSGPRPPLRHTYRCAPPPRFGHEMACG